MAQISTQWAALGALALFSLSAPAPVQAQVLCERGACTQHTTSPGQRGGPPPARAARGVLSEGPPPMRAARGVVSGGGPPPARAARGVLSEGPPPVRAARGVFGGGPPPARAVTGAMVGRSVATANAPFVRGHAYGLAPLAVGHRYARYGNEIYIVDETTGLILALAALVAITN